MRTPLLYGAGLLLALACHARAEDKEPDVVARLKKAKVDGPFTLVVVVKVKEGEEAAFLKAAKTCVAATRKEKGCLHYEVLEDLENPRQFVFHERWKNVEALADHFKTEHLKTLVAALPSFLDGAPKFAMLRSTDKQ